MKARYTYFLMLFVLFIVFPPEYKAQKPPFLVAPDSTVKKASKKYDFTNLGVKDGVYSSGIYKVCQDSKGNYWIAGSEGLSKYNGKEVFTFKHPLVKNKRIWTVYEDSRGRIWCGTERNGVLFYDGKGFTRLLTDSILPYSSVMDIQEGNNGALWFSGNNGLARYKDEKLSWIINRKDTILQKVFKTYIHENRVYICAQTGLYYYENGRINKYLPDVPRVVNCRSLFIDEESNHYIGTWGLGIVIHYAANDSIVNYGSSLTNNVVWDIQKDHKGRIWMATDYGINILDNDELYALTEKNGLSNNRVWSLTQDQINRMWIACYGGGISIYNGDLFNYLYKDNGLTDKGVNIILKTRNGTYWIGTNGSGLIKYKEGKFTHYKDHSVFRNNYVWNLYEDQKGAIWICVDAALVKYENGKFYKYTQSHEMPSDLVWSITQMGRDHYLIGSYSSGLMELKGNRFSRFKGNDKLGNTGVHDLFEDSSERIWMIASDKVVVMNDRNDLTILNDAHGIYSPRISDIKEDSDQNIWIATGKGISIIKKGTDLKNHLLLNKKNGLPLNYCLNIQFINDTAVWLGSMRGIYRVSYSWDGDSIKVNSSRFYGGSSGFREIEVVGSTKYNSPPEDEYWFPTPKGITVANKVKVEEFKPSVYLKGLDLFYQNIDWESPFPGKEFSGDIEFDTLMPRENLPVSPVFSYNLNHITFKFQGGNTRSIDLLRYTFKLEGFEEDWSPLTTTGNATYSNIPPGDYTFMLKSSDENNQESEIIKYGFTITPPFWENWWFRAASGTLAFFLLLGFIRLRTVQLRKNKEELEKTVQNRTNEIREQKELLEQKSAEITDSFNYAKRIQKAILPSHKTFNNVFKDAFVFYLPKDIVAGDFYWMEAQPPSNLPAGEDSGEAPVYFAAADCTGHGVPGAMVSVICSNALSKAVIEEGITDPGKILDRTRELVIERFGKSKEEIKDGMDIALCKLSLRQDQGTAQGQLSYAGAHNPLWIIRKNAKEVEEIKADKQPIGRYATSAPFTTHEVQLNEGDSIYIFSDGFTDQFGGEKGKKYKSGKFKKLLVSIQDKDMSEQRKLISEEFENWKGDLDQLDDVCIIGVKV